MKKMIRSMLRQEDEYKVALYPLTPDDFEELQRRIQEKIKKLEKKEKVKSA